MRFIGACAEVAPDSADYPLLVVILGPTASGKTTLSLALAEKFNGEIVNCDSVAMYREFDIGTAKPSRAERERAPHHLFDCVDPAGVCRGARYPRGREDWGSVGILAQRAKDRPNRLGASTCELVDVRGLDLEVRGLDAVDGTPVLDVKPHMTGFEPRSPVRRPRWAGELMAGYW